MICQPFSVRSGSWKPVSTLATRVSSFSPKKCRFLENVTTTFQKIHDLGTFTKSAKNTFIEVTLQAALIVINFNAGTTAVIYELRIDDDPANYGQAVAIIPAENVSSQVSVTGVFNRLVYGSHTVSLWACSVSGTAGHALYDPGCFSTTSVIIKEFR